MSPITIAWSPIFWKAAHAVSPIGGVILTWSAIVTDRSLRGTDTLNTPDLSSILPLAPVSASILAVSRLAGPGAGFDDAAGIGGGAGGGTSGGGATALLQPTTPAPHRPVSW